MKIGKLSQKKSCKIELNQLYVTIPKIEHTPAGRSDCRLRYCFLARGGEKSARYVVFDKCLICVSACLSSFTL